MKRRSTLLIIAGIAAIAPVSAQACELDDPVEIFFDAIHQSGKVRAVALVRVTKVELLPVTDHRWPKGFPPNWHAWFQVEKMIRGSAKTGQFEREQHGGPGTCDYAPAPKVNDLRMLYIFDSGVVYDVDLDSVPQFDAALRLSPRKN